ncbi:MAG: hypothetical protein ACK58J_13500, partial [Planctomyces sp.]
MPRDSGTRTGGGPAGRSGRLRAPGEGLRAPEEGLRAPEGAAGGRLLPPALNLLFCFFILASVFFRTGSVEDQIDDL